VKGEYLSIETVFKGKEPDTQRWYRNTETKAEQPGVSAIVDMMPKNALTPWASRLAAEYAVGNMDLIRDMVRDAGEKAAIDWVKGASSRYSGKASSEGTAVHHWTETVARAVMQGEKPKGDRVPESMFPYLKNYVRFLKEFDVEPVMLETVVWDDKIGYAGRLDMACRLRTIDDSLVIVDTKSGASGVWESVALQQTAYRYADTYWDEDDNTFKPMPEVSATYALWLRPEGYALIPVESTEMELNQLARLRGSLEWKLKRGKKVVLPAINRYPIKRQRRW
jgi:hypothetical protein